MEMKVSKLKQVITALILASGFNLYMSSVWAFGPSRSANDGNPVVPEVEDVDPFKAKMWGKHLETVLSEAVNGPTPDVNKFRLTIFLGDPEQNDFSFNPEETPSGVRIAYAVYDSSLESSKICLKDRVFLIGVGPNEDPVSAGYGTVFTKDQVDAESYFPKQPDALDRPLAWQDIMSKTTRLLNPKQLSESPGHEEHLELVIISSLIDMRIAAAQADRERFELGQKIIQQACSNEVILSDAIQAMTENSGRLEEPDFLTQVKEAGVPVYDYTNNTSSSGDNSPAQNLLPVFASIFNSDLESNLRSVYPASDNNFHFSAESVPDGVEAYPEWEFLAIDGANLPKEISSCQNLGYTYLINPNAETPLLFGFPLESAALDNSASSTKDFFKTDADHIPISEARSKVKEGEALFDASMKAGKSVVTDDPEQKKLLQSIIVLRTMPLLRSSILCKSEKIAAAVGYFMMNTCNENSDVAIQGFIDYYNDVEEMAQRVGSNANICELLGGSADKLRESVTSQSPGNLKELKEAAKESGVGSEGMTQEEAAEAAGSAG